MQTKLDKAFKIIVDISNRKVTIPQAISWYVTDENIAHLNCQIIDEVEDSIIDIQSYKLSMRVLTPSTILKEVNYTLSDATNNIFTLTLPDELITEKGRHQCELSIEYLGDKLTSEPFNYNIIQSIANQLDSTISKDSHYPLVLELEDKLKEWNNILDEQVSKVIILNNDVRNAEKTRQANEAQRIEAENTRSEFYEGFNDRLNEVDSQLAHNTSKLERKIYYCSSVADLIITDFKKGDTVKTLSYYSEANIGGGIYEITDKKDNLCLSLDNGLFAKLIVENELNIFCMGVTREDTNNNNAEIINRCASICIEKKHTLFMPYETIKINNNISLFGLKDINIRGVINCAVEGLKVEIGYYASGTLAHSYYYINNITNGTLSLTGLKRGYLQFQKAKVFEIVCDSEVSGKGSNAYNTILLGDCEEINITRHNDAWINENLFIGGRAGILNMNTGHNNVFLKLCIEKDVEGNGYYLSGNCADNKFIDARGEGYLNIQFG